jgi:hypothetical protein
MQVIIEVTNPLAREQTMTKVQDKAKVIAIKELPGACPSSRWRFGGESDSDLHHEQAFPAIED